MQSDYIGAFVAEKRAKNIPWSQISKMLQVHPSKIEPYKALEEGQQAAKIRDAANKKA